MSSTQIYRQRFIAYAFMGYLDFLRRTRTTDPHIHSTFGGRGTIEPKMENTGVRQEVIDLIAIADELELAWEWSGSNFDEVLARALAPVIQFLCEDCAPTQGVLTPVEVLLAATSGAEAYEANSPRKEQSGS